MTSELAGLLVGIATLVAAFVLLGVGYYAGYKTGFADRKNEES